jgi:hypothetical protein
VTRGADSVSTAEKIPRLCYRITRFGIPHAGISRPLNLVNDREGAEMHQGLHVNCPLLSDFDQKWDLLEDGRLLCCGTV